MWKPAYCALDLAATTNIMTDPKDVYKAKGVELSDLWPKDAICAWD